MSKRKLTIALILALSLVLALAGALPAISHEDPCPDGYTETPTLLGFGAWDDKDRNGDGLVCTKTVPGEGNSSSDLDIIDNQATDNHDHG